MLPKRSRLSCQDKKSGLENVFSILWLVQKAPNNAPNQSTMPADKRREGTVVASGDPTPKELAVRSGFTALRIEENAETVKKQIDGFSHDRSPGGNW
ncbi:MAG TPA: hypothetical protein VGZ47_00895 [Gemmataceae bacterium]|nr:hypothetical protein [Gemmataceae bacterium]